MFINKSLILGEMVSSSALERSIDAEGFIDVPRILSEDSIGELFPELIPNLEDIRARDFPNFGLHGRIYLDSAATSQEPLSVLERMHEYRRTQIRGSNHSRNSAEAKEAQERFDEAREKVGDFFNAHNYIVGFTSGTTDCSNFVATRFPFGREDILILTEMEHNSQILTARNFAKKAGADVAYVPISKEGRLDLDFLYKVVSKRKGGTILLNLVHASNVTGIVNPVEEIRNILGDRGFIYLDMAQSAGHIPINLDSLDVDFAGVSSHKMYGPMGIGAVFINKRSERYIGNDISGGSAVDMVSKWFTATSSSPERFEPGTQDLEGAIEWGFAIDYLRDLGMDKVEAHDRQLGEYFIGELQKIPGIRVYGPAEFRDRIPVVTFNINSIIRKNYDTVARDLDARGISVRDGCFCAHMGMSRLLGIPALGEEARAGLMTLGISKNLIKLPGAVRTSFAFYNNIQDAYAAVCAIREICEK